MSYDLEALKAPRAAGGLLRAFTALVESPLTRSLLGKMLLRDAGIDALRAVPCSAALPTEHPLFALTPPPGAREASDLQLPGADGRERAEGFAFERAQDFTDAYREGRLTPTDVAERILEATAAGEAQTPAMRTFIAQSAEDVRAMARSATARWSAGEPIGPLDGVPVAVKDELDQTPYPTTVGTAFLGTPLPGEDATVVARLRAAGAMLIGKANMHEMGLGVTGLNPHHGAARNPYDPDRATGGSSSGSAAAVAAGLCPIAVGADGGGSIRIPASLCGVVGLKPTFGRVSEHGAAPLCWSVAHVGPIAATATDAALGYAIMAGADRRDANSLRQPTPDLDGWDQPDLKGVRLGIYRPWFEDADPAVVDRCEGGLEVLRAAGAELVEVQLSELALVRTAHLVTIIAEMATAHMVHYAHNRGDYGLDTRLNLALARQLTGYDYVHAQRHRNRLSQQFFAVLETVDALVIPSTGCTAPLLPRDALASGESNLPLTDRIMRFSPAANLTGLPAISFPVGYDDGGLPVGLQCMGRPWSESLLLRLARAVEPSVARMAPRVHTRLLR